MDDYQKDFIQLAIEQQVLRFGEFTLKSGRVSPYFFNAGLIRSGEALRRTGQAYAKTIQASGVQFDMLFGPAYKGIPLATATAIAYSELNSQDLPVVYNRKEPKAHGEGGQLVGGPLQGRILVIDDVITAGTAIREVISMIDDSDAELAGIVVGLDRQERGQGHLSAIQELAAEQQVPVLSIISLEALLRYIAETDGLAEHVRNLQEYRKQYGV